MLAVLYGIVIQSARDENAGCSLSRPQNNVSSNTITHDLHDENRTTAFVRLGAKSQTDQLRDAGDRLGQRDFALPPMAVDEGDRLFGHASPLPLQTPQ